MDSNKSNKIRDIVKLQQILKKWRKKAANAPKTTAATTSGGAVKGLKFIKRTLSFTDLSSSPSNDHVPKGFLAVCVGKDLKRYIIPTEYLSHHGFQILLREAEEEFGFEQEGVLRIPCEVSVFEKMVKVVEGKMEYSSADYKDQTINGCFSPEITPSHDHPQMCR